MFDHAKDEGFLRDSHRDLVIEATSPETLLDLFDNFQPTSVAKWMDRDNSISNYLPN
jgi:hypothetical protein